jgi:NhaP-type Na+/H+ or K+/H+ antiporter
VQSDDHESPAFFADIAWTGWMFAVLAIFAARPIALRLSFLGSGLGAREQLAAMWFGPKGFASVVYGLLVPSAAIPAGDTVFILVALTIVMSIVLHSSTNVLIARTFDEAGLPGWQQRLQQRGRRLLRRRAQRSTVAGVEPAQRPPAGSEPDDSRR